MKRNTIRGLAALCLTGALLMGTAIPASASEADDIEAMKNWLNGLTVTQQAPSGSSGSAAASSEALTADELSAYADKVFELVNAEREKAGLALLERDSLLDEAAMIRAAEIVENYTHTRPNGDSYFSVLDDLDIQRKSSGEIIYSSPTTPESAVKGWMNSDSHRNRILKEEYTATGIGVYQDKDGGLHWVQLFIKEK